MAGSTNKKVVVVRFDREPLPGFVNPQAYLQPGGIELMSPDGAVQVVPYEDAKTICFVRDFDNPPVFGDRRFFASRPKTEGLWVRMQFRDGEEMDGLLPNNLLQLEPQGFTVVTPDPSARNQRLFVPRAALKEFRVLGVVGSPLRRRKPKPVPKEQLKMFE